MKNLKNLVLVIVCVLFLASASFAQKTAADKSWKSFWTRFRVATKVKNWNALKKMMVKDFFNGGGAVEGDMRDDWLKSLKNDERFWRDHQLSVAKGTKSCGNNCRETVNKYLVFEYKKGRWLWTGIYGD